jgi:hypothetical protein
MQNRWLIDFAGILLTYCVYAGITYAVYQDDILGLGEYSLIMVGASLFCMLAWYALGEWGIKPWASSGVWLGTWFFLLAVVAATATVIYFLDYPNSDPYLLFGGGIGAYYLASVLFSPAGAKYRIWPAIHVRSW